MKEEEQYIHNIQRPFSAPSIIIENHNPQNPWETAEDVYLYLYENSWLRRQIYQRARSMFMHPDDRVRVDHELFPSALFIYRSHTDRRFRRLLRQRLEEHFLEEWTQRIMDGVRD